MFLQWYSRCIHSLSQTGEFSPGEDFDEKGEHKDQFSTKPVESKYGKKSYRLTYLAFSPDGSRIAVGQSDHIVFVYKIGQNWDEKKVIINKLMQTAPVRDEEVANRHRWQIHNK